MKIWMRVGATVYLNEKEAETLLNGDNAEAKDLLKRMIYDNRFRLDGETYIPESSIEEFNEMYDKHYQPDEYEYMF